MEFRRRLGSVRLRQSPAGTPEHACGLPVLMGCVSVVVVVAGSTDINFECAAINIVDAFTDIDFEGAYITFEGAAIDIVP